MAESVKVLVRCRPFNRRETDMGCKSVISMDSTLGQCSLVNPADGPNAPPKTFTYDGVYYMDSTAEQLYNELVYPLVENCLEGYNATVFAYGQTGSGKTFTMQGIETPPTQRGIIPRTFEHIFEVTSTSNMKFLIHGSYLEIYNEEVRDLLGKDIKQKLEIKEHPEKGVYVAGLSLHPCHNKTECEQLMSTGFKNRSVGATLMNVDSSRSHSIFSIYMETMQVRDDGEHIRTAKLHLVDLAGSERQSKTGATGDRFKEATKINLSLSALGNVISALVDGKSKHIPYRDSKLTRLLQDSLGGNTKTLMVACISPADNNYDESLSTLRYANRAKNIKNKPKINEDPKDALLREYQEEIDRLKQMLEGGGGAGAQVAVQRQPSIDLEQERAKLRAEFEEQMNQLKEQYQLEQKNKTKLEEDLMRMKSDFEGAQAKLEKAAAAEAQRLANLAAPEEGTKAPHGSPKNRTQGQTIDSQEAVKRLEMLQHQMVGGEAANNAALREKRQKRKREAEKRQQKLADALSKIESDDPMLHVYNSTQEKLAATTKELQKEKNKAKALENEVHDLHSEFELDRIDYLDTIRRQDQQIKLLQQILDKVQPTIRRDCNYANLDKIRREATWDDDTQKWHLPDFTVSKTQLPQAGGIGGMMHAGARIPGAPISPRNGYAGLFDEPEDNKLKQRLETSAQEDIAGNYFKPTKGQDTVMARIERDKQRSLSPAGDQALSSNFPKNQINWEKLMGQGVLYTNDIYERTPATSPNHIQQQQQQKRPQRLEALNGLQAVPVINGFGHQPPGIVASPATMLFGNGAPSGKVTINNNKNGNIINHSKQLIRPSW